MTLGSTAKLVKPVSLFLYYPRCFAPHWQVWRLLSNFLFFDSRFSLSWFLRMFFFVQYSASLERESFAGRTADFAWMWLFGVLALLLLNAALFYSPLAHLALPFLGPSLTFMLTYVWSRRNPAMRMSLFGLFEFAAPYLPWVLIGVGIMIDADPIYDVLGLIVGHVYYYLEDVVPVVFPRAPQILRTPTLLKRLLDPPVVVPPPVPPMPADAPHED
jgi:Derlin-2/3